MALLRLLIGLLYVARLCTSQCQGVKVINFQKTGEVSNPSYGKGKYGSNLNCKYKLKAPEGQRIRLTFLDLDIAFSTSCVSDRLEIHDKDQESIIGVFCGNVKPRPILSHEFENEVLLVFKTDKTTKGGKGFRIQYESALHFDICPPNQGVCNNRNCYNVRYACDGDDDCRDGTDEEDCSYAPPSMSCGYTPSTPRTVFGSPDRMVGGEPVRPNSWPWHASIQDIKIEPNGHFCSGTLISAQWVLSAARCFKGITYPKSIRVTLGSHRLFDKSIYEQVRRAVKIIVYPDLEGEELKEIGPEDNFALIKLNAPVKSTSGVVPACLPQPDWKEKNGWNCYATGWGENKGAGFSDELKQSYYKIKTLGQCSHNSTTEMCVQFDNSGLCKDDAGGPLVCKLSYNYRTSWFVLGTASRAAKENPRTGFCSALKSKLIFMKVAPRADWIRKTIQKYS